MFGYVITNCKTLSEEERARFRAMYCGMCHTLKKRYGNLSRFTLSYDMTFLAMVLSALHVFFNDISYLYGILTTLLMYMSVIFYTLDVFSPTVQKLFYLNPVYNYIHYFRSVVIYGEIPSLWHHLLCLGYAAAAMLAGMGMYKKYNYRFLYYI